MGIVQLDQFRPVNVDLGGRVGAKDAVDPFGTDGQTDPEEHVDAVVQDVDAVVAQFVHRAADGRRQSGDSLVFHKRRRRRRSGRFQQGHQSRVQIRQTGSDVHRLDGKHVEGPVVDRHVLAAREGVAIEQTVDVERQQFHALGQNQLAGRGRRGAILAVAGQDLGAPVDQRVPK